ADVNGLGAADIALLEIVEDKMGFDLPELPENVAALAGKKRSTKK
ncbi:hypothetical protein Cflav_PD0087, partial [Pedosphaera parvula Ellin514]